MNTVFDQAIEAAGEGDFTYETLPESSLYVMLKNRCTRFLTLAGSRAPERILDNERRLISLAAAEVTRRATGELDSAPAVYTELTRFVNWLHEWAPDPADVTRDKLLAMYAEHAAAGYPENEHSLARLEAEADNDEPEYHEIEVPEYGTHPGAVIREYD